ncbi:type 1 glutamine amidotransferase [Arthrobacter sp. GCM10027362]|uniref:type 1 glutamine amidotransferase n=1 Tax=Arthrobacter sp. GCM10027362 TaxID=3273379 RepID=UPI0036282258
MGNAVSARILELRHVEPEGPAAYLPVLHEYAEVETVRLWQEPVPQGRDFSAVVVMGGPMGANDGGQLPWIDEEIAFLRAAVAAGTPVWGVCLGAQLLAAALGARVQAGPRPEVGVLPVRLTGDGAADPVWGGLPVSFPVLQWHSDTFELPAESVLLASSPQYPHQLFRHGNSYGVQFHLEADAALAGQWLGIEDYRQALEQVLGPGAAPDVLAALRQVEAGMVQHAQSAIRRWLENCGLPGPRPRI